MLAYSKIIKYFIFCIFISSIFFSTNSIANDIKLISSSAAGGITHRYALIIRDVLAKEFNKNVTLEIKGGAEGLIAARYLVSFNHKNDVVLMIGSPKDWKEINSNISQISDLLTLSYLGYMPHLLVTTSNSNINSLVDFLKLSETQHLSYGISQNNPSRDFIKKIIKKYGNSDNIVEITFKSGSEVLLATLGNHINVGIAVPDIFLSEIEKQRIKIISSIGSFNDKREFTLDQQNIKIENEFKYLNHFFLWSNKTLDKKTINQIQSIINNYLISSNFIEIKNNFNLIMPVISNQTANEFLKDIIDR